eukprot:g1699.t1
MTFGFDDSEEEKEKELSIQVEERVPSLDERLTIQHQQIIKHLERQEQMLNKLLTRRAVNPSEMSSVNSLRSPFDPVTPGDAGDWGEPWELAQYRRAWASRPILSGSGGLSSSGDASLALPTAQGSSPSLFQSFTAFDARSGRKFASVRMADNALKRSIISSRQALQQVEKWVYHPAFDAWTVRTVYFTINEYQDDEAEDPQAYMVLKTTGREETTDEMLDRLIAEAQVRQLHSVPMALTTPEASPFAFPAGHSIGEDFSILQSDAQRAHLDNFMTLVNDPADPEWRDAYEERWNEFYPGHPYFHEQDLGRLKRWRWKAEQGLPRLPALGFVLDMSEYTAYGKTLDKEIEIVNINRLPAIRLHPGDENVKGIAMSMAEDYDMDDEQVRDKDDVTDDNETDDDENMTDDVDSNETESNATSSGEHHLPLNEQKKKIMSKGQKKMLSEVMDDLEKEDCALWSTLQGTTKRHKQMLPKGCRCFLKEIFAGAATLSLMAVLEGNRTKKAQQWPKELCQAILEGALAELKSQVICHAFPAEFEIEDNETTGHLDGVQDLDDIAEQVHKRRRIDFDALDTEEDHEQGQDAAVEVLLHEKERQRKQKWLKISREQRVAIRRIHQMMGHCSNQALVRMLRLSLAEKEVFRVIRLTRVIKTVRLVRIFRFVIALRTLVTSIVHTLKALFWALTLLVLIAPRRDRVLGTRSRHVRVSRWMTVYQMLSRYMDGPMVL